MTLKYLAASLGQGDEDGPGVTFEGRDGADQARLPQPLQIPMAHVSAPAHVIAQIVRRHHAKRADRGERAHLGPA